MRINGASTLNIIAPGLIEQSWSEAEALGSATWLWMHSKRHKEMPLMSMPTLLLPAIKNKQFILAIETGRPVFYLSWANLSYEAERRYLQHVLQLREDEWSSGDRMWVLDWVAPFGHSRLLSQMLEHQLFATRWMRALYHRGNERGLKVKTFIGKAVLPEEAREWFASNPIAFSTPNQNATISTEIT